ncbi:MAG: MarR family winged helix-turn-helix transcriptional regulator [Acidiferrobacter sp.]
MFDLKRQAALRESIELLYFGYRAFTSRADRILDRHDLGRVHHRILYFVGRHPDIPVHALLDTLSVTKQALNAPLRQLLTLKLVSSKTAVFDRRVKLLNLTEAGRTIEAQLTATQMEHLARVFDSIGPRAEKDWQAVMAGLSHDTQ